MLARADDEQAEFVGAFPEDIARGGVWQIESDHEAAATDGGDGGILAGQGLEFGQEGFTFDARVFDEAFLLDYPEVMGGADIVSEIAAPGRANAAGEAEAVVFDFIEARPGYDATDLGLLAEDQQVRQHVEMLAAPVPAGNAHATLDFVEDEQEVVVVANLPQRAQEFAAEMVVAALALDRLDGNNRDIRGV